MHTIIKKYLYPLCISVFCIFSSASASGQSIIRYVALGDSYTIGSGGSPQDSWPAVLTRHWQQQGIPIVLVANLGREGWTTQNLIDYQLPIFEKVHPDFVSIMIGVNDWVQGVDPGVFEEHFHFILDKVLAVIPDHKRIIIITIPDFSVMPTGNQYAAGRDIAAGIAAFNQIIKKQASLHGLNVIDLYPLSQGMGQDPSLAASDGLHPSAKGYALWADFIGKALN